MDASEWLALKAEAEQEAAADRAEAEEELIGEAQGEMMADVEEGREMLEGELLVDVGWDLLERLQLVDRDLSIELLNEAQTRELQKQRLELTSQLQMLYNLDVKFSIDGDNRSRPSSPIEEVKVRTLGATRSGPPIPFTPTTRILISFTGVLLTRTPPHAPLSPSAATKMLVRAGRPYARVLLRRGCYGVDADISQPARCRMRPLPRARHVRHTTCGGGGGGRRATRHLQKGDGA